MNKEEAMELYNNVVALSNAVHRQTLGTATEEDIDILEQRRLRIYSAAWFKKDTKNLAILTYRDRCFVMFLVDENTQENYIATDPVTSEPNAEIWFELDNGQMDMHHRINTVPACIAMKIVEFFMETGEMRPCIAWINGNKIDKKGDDGC